MSADVIVPKNKAEIKKAVGIALTEIGYKERGVTKALDDTALVAGDGEIHPEQRDRHYQYLRAPRPSILPAVRLERTDSGKLDLDKIMVGQPVSDWPDDDGNETETANIYVGGTIPIDCQKSRASAKVTYRAFRRNIEKGAIVKTVAMMVAERARYDVELVMMRGDKTTYSAGTDRVSKLLKKLDGIEVKTRESPRVNGLAANLGEDMFDELFKLLPDEAKQDPGLAWTLSPNARVVWNKIMRNKVGSNADAAQKGEYRIGPHGFNLIETPAIPSNMAVTIAGGAPGRARTKEPGPYRITSATKNIRLNINAAGNTTDIDLSGGKADAKWTAGQIANRINAFLLAAGGYGAAYQYCAATDSEGHLTITAPGNNQAVVVVAGSSLDATAALTLDIATNNGAASNGTSYKGSYILLANPMMYVLAMVDEIRAYIKFFEERDYFGIYQYQDYDIAVEDTDKVARLDNFLCQ